MIVRLHKGQLDYFRRKARKNSDREIYAVLIGKHASKSVLEVHDFLHPKPEDYEQSTASAVTVTADFVVACEYIAKELNLYVVGSIHTHPNWPPIMSATDHCTHKESGDKVSGIVEVTNGKTRVAFWRHDSSLRCSVEHF